MNRGERNLVTRTLGGMERRLPELGGESDWEGVRPSRLQCNGIHYSRIEKDGITERNGMGQKGMAWEATERGEVKGSRGQGEMHWSRIKCTGKKTKGQFPASHRWS